MSVQEQQTIQVNSRFNADDYPGMIKEVAAIRNMTSKVAPYYKTQIVISFYKDHSLHHDWVETNPELSELVSKGSFKSSHIETLFTMCRGDKNFLDDFESYISQNL